MTNYTQQSDNLGKMGQFSGRHNLPKITEGKINNLTSVYLFKKLNQ